MRRFFSQFGEDRVLARIFAGRQNGVCVEVGANNGVYGSTTLYFERLGWECVLVEPNPDLCRNLRAERAGRVFECAASSASGVATLQVAIGSVLAHAVSALGGDESAALILKQHGLATRPVEVATRRLDEVLEEARLSGPIDFVSIDVEGHELELLKGFAVERWRPRILIVEDNGGSWFNDVSRELSRRGYLRFRRTGVNDWYAQRGDLRLSGGLRRLAYWPSMVMGRCLTLTLRVVDRLRRLPGGREVWALLGKDA